MNLDGIISCSRYAFMPNRLKYCGPDKNRDLFEYGAQKIVDGGLTEILAEFQTLYPYLNFIALSNKIADPFDRRAVEAYWIGNSLLENVKMPEFYGHLLYGQGLKKRIDRKSLEYLIGKIPLGARPHHSFHVFNVFTRTGHAALAHTVETMDKCRISWGRIIEIKKDKLVVSAKLLKMENKKLVLVPEQDTEVWREFNDKTFIKNPKIGDRVSIHWNWACEILSPRQVRNLEYYTSQSLKLANLTI